MGWFDRTVGAIRTLGAGATLWTFATSSLAGAYLWGPALTAWAFISGWREGVPTPYLLAACSTIFGMISWAFLQISLLSERSAIKDRLSFQNMRVSRNINGAGIILGTQIISRATAPIQIELQEVRTRIGNRVPERNDFALRTWNIPSQGTFHFDDHVIDIGNAPQGGTLEGFADFRFKYGHPGNLKYELSIKKQVVVAFNDQGVFQGASWNDAA